MITRLIRNQLRIFAVIAVLALSWVGVVYAELPSRFGFGHYAVDVEFGEASGLYPRANVTYRGKKVGKVAALELTRDGVRAELAIDSGTTIPADVRAELRSTSAIGEQYVDLVPQSAKGELADGSVIPVEQTVEMPQIGPVLDELTDLMDSVPAAASERLLDRVDAGLTGTGEDLGGLLDEADQLLVEATRNVEATTGLVRSSAPMLTTQQDLAGDTRAWIEQMAKVTTSLEAGDDSVDALLDEGTGGLDATARLLADVDPVLPSLLHNTRAVAEPLRVYNSFLEQTLATYPALMSRFQSISVGRQQYGDARLDIRTMFGDPDSCVNGYVPVKSRRNPSDATLSTGPSGSYCKEGPANVAVRGARNIPCPDDTGRRAPTAAACGIELTEGVPAAGVTTYTSFAPQDAVEGRYRDETGRQHRLDTPPVGLDADGDDGKDEGWKSLLTAALR
ncbi:MCE family protein [Nocardioides daeguensis]|uniref:MCE family protein n=2 Tax=Nocardioides daeguensis TaxID=908359 RepID=A0ABP6UUN3_9ACTN|nr:MlaD family protein [Nocardioides daeguensis]MBV6725562.1 MCE family protein [Nocardioides daeguensis]MCR1771422.1 MCE family protein [Nocardioides daeguensis]